jgi:DNA-binding YbaB/EbfC family protein
MLDKMKQLYQLQKKAKEIQKELRDTEIEAKSSNGLVTVVYNGEQKLVSINIASSLLTPERKQELEQTIVRVVSEAQSRAQAIAAEKTKDVMKDMGMNIPGL